MVSLRSLAKIVLPEPLLNEYRKLKAERAKNASIFSYIYEHNIWGKPHQDSPFNSGTGSTSTAEFTEKYCDFVVDFIRKKNIKQVVELGCGDFRVSRKIAIPAVNYIGIDVVDKLIEYNQANYANEHISFFKKDIVLDKLPNGELCLIRQVLQHLSNDAILKILPKLKKYKYVLITEHQLPDDGSSVPNLNISTGPKTRISINSALHLDKPPFNVKNIETVLESPLSNEYKLSAVVGESLKTFLLTNN